MRVLTERIAYLLTRKELPREHYEAEELEERMLPGTRALNSAERDMAPSRFWEELQLAPGERTR